MKKRFWLPPIPIILGFAIFQATFDLGEQGKLNSDFLRKEIYPFSKNANGIMTNIKFKIRGKQAPHPDIGIIVVDNNSVEKLGRWPWHREYYARIFHYAFENFGAKNIALDMVYSEPEETLSPDVAEYLEKDQPKIYSKIKTMGGDLKLSQVIELHRDNLVMGYVPTTCQPGYEKKGDCPVHHPQVLKKVESGIGKFASVANRTFTPAQLETGTLPSIVDGIFNIPLFLEKASHAASFGVDPDPDGFIRKYSLYYTHNNKYFPQLATKMAELMKGDELKIELDANQNFEKVYFSKDPAHSIPVTSLGYIGLNFKGPSEIFPYISAVEIIEAVETGNPELTAKLDKMIRGKSLFFGVTAVGIYDMRAFPFDSNTPGVEGHATALSNILQGDSLRTASSIQMEWLPLAMIILVGVIFTGLFSFLDAVPAILVFIGFILGFGFLDTRILFGNNINLPTAFIYGEAFLIFATVLSMRYIIEERNKKQIKDAFSHYLAPSVVDMVLKDQSKLTVGGERRDLTIMFSDLRGFTTISEGMDPKTLSQFLNEYLTAMTDCVFENQGTLDKYIGDAVMAFWGAPIPQEDHILRACQTACLMQKKLEVIAPDFKKRYNIDVGMGVGVNSGTVSVGNMGSQKIFEYTVLGDHVNLASRLEGLTRIYGVGVLSTKSTMDLLYSKYPNQVFYRVLDAVKVKGKKVATDLVEVSLDAFDAKADELFQTARKTFVSRDWELAKQQFEESSRIFEQKRGFADPVASMFSVRCEYFKTHPPVADWDGSIEMKEK